MDQKNSEKEVRRHEKAEILIEALPFMRRYAGKSIVVKFGGNAMGEQAYAEAFAADMMLLRQVGRCLLWYMAVVRRLATC